MKNPLINSEQNETIQGYYINKYWYNHGYSKFYIALEKENSGWRDGWLSS